MRSVLLMVPFFLVAPAWAADDCMSREVDGIWKNRLGVHFSVRTAPDCSTVRVTDLGSSRVYDLGISGATTTVDLSVDGMNLALSTWAGPSRFWEYYGGQIIWEAPAPYLPIRPSVEIGFAVELVRDRSTRRIVKLNPWIHGIYARKGSPGNFLEEGMIAIVNVIRRLNISEYLSAAFRVNNTLFRVE